MRMSMRMVLETMSLMALLSLASVQGMEEQELCNEVASDRCFNPPKALQYKIIAIFSILVSGIIGIGLPLVLTSLPMLHHDKKPTQVLKVFAGGIILATGFMHVLPESWRNLNSECLPEDPWRAYPWSALIAMLAAIATMMMDSTANAYLKRRGLKKIRSRVSSSTVGSTHNIESPSEDQDTELVVRHQATPDNAIINKDEEDKECQLIRYRTVIQILILGTVVHEVVIGFAMGVSNNSCVIRSLLAATCVDQVFQGMGMGGCLLQAEYNTKMKTVMVTLFTTTTPLGIALGIGLQSIYDHQSPVALIVAGISTAISAGILIYLSLVDLLACEFMGNNCQENIKFQYICYFAALLGVGVISLMAKWA